MPPVDETSLRMLSDIINAGVSSKLVYEGSICDTYPCWNDGICVESNQTSSSYLCLCNDLFTGDHCQVKLADNCSEITCPPGTFCPLGSASSCLPIGHHGTFPSCLTNPCLNDGSCILIDGTRHRCLCPEGFHGLLCQSSTSLPPIGPLTGLQTLFLFSMVIFLAAGLLIFCYGGNLSCYLLMPGKKRYTKWVDISEELSWDNMDEEEEDVVGGSDFFRSGYGRTNRFEMRNRPIQLSSTTETFVTYDPNGGSTSNPHGPPAHPPVDI